MKNTNCNIEEEAINNKNMKKYILTVSIINTVLIVSAIVILLLKTCCI